MPVRVGSLFSGYGGLDLALERVLGAETRWVSEIEPAAVRVLKHRFPGVPNLGDVTDIDWSEVEPVDVVCGGSPCQDISVIGRGAGMFTGTRSGLWAYMAGAVQHLQPKFVLWENVRGAFSARAEGGYTAVGRVVRDLADMGYVSRWGVVRASDAGLPHRRERIFLVARRSSDSEDFGSQWAGELGGETPGEGSCGGTSDSPRWFDPRALPPEPLVRDPAVKYGWRLNAQFNEWVMGLPVGWVTEVPGVSRAQALHMLGNGAAPPQVALALNYLL